jgi:hypothetical protein
MMGKKLSLEMAVPSVKWMATGLMAAIKLSIGAGIVLLITTPMPEVRHSHLGNFTSDSKASLQHIRYNIIMKNRLCGLVDRVPGY